LQHLRWRELLGRDALSRRFYRDLEAAVATLARTARGRADAADRRAIALLTTSRLLFLAFLEAKGWLDRDRAFLRHQVERLAPTGPLHATLLEPLCFGTLNTPVGSRARAAVAFGRVPFLNGGLFQRSAVETRARALRLEDEAIAAVVCDLLPRYRLTARETSRDLSDAAVDPEMLGRAFESLMGAEVRRAHGAFYTPPPLIARLTGGALAALARQGDDRDLASLRVMDPACGSGAFLVHALETIAALRIARGDARRVSVVRREVLTRGIFGVDLDPMAVWLCQLRLWLSVVVEDDREDPMRFPPLPNLDRNIRQGDALAGHAFEDARLPDGAELAPLRLRYARASGARKRTLGRALDHRERARAIAAASQLIARCTAERRELLIAVRSPDLFRARRGPDAAARRALDTVRERLRAARAALRRLRDGGALPFSFATHFPEISAAGGVDIVVGNPPWVRPHALPAALRESLRERFVTARHAAWESGADAAGAGRGFASQVDLAALFTERAVQLVRPGGVLALLLPSKLWSALAGGGVRDLLVRRTRLIAVDDWGDASAGFDAVVYPSSIIARRPAIAGTTCADTTVDGPGEAPASLRLTLHRERSARAFVLDPAALAVDGTPGAPWLLLPPEVRDAFAAFERAGIPLAASAFGRPMLGVKSGCNDAFLVETGASDGAIVPVRSGETLGVIERALLRPLARGEHVRRWVLATGAATQAIVWTHESHGAPRAALPPHATAWMQRWRRRLEARTDGRGGHWWALFRTEAARDDRPRVVWGDIGRTPRALVLPAGDPTVPLNTCYVVRAPSEEDAHALAALLNSRLVSSWLCAVAEPARGGFRRFLGWTCARLPVPRDWPGARARLAPLGSAGAAGVPPDDDTLDREVAAAYGIDHVVMAPLLAWHH
jgi:N-6 DNA Methylase